MHALRLIHRWIGILVALPVVLVALSGGALLARDPYYRARWPIVSEPLAPVDIAQQAAMLTLIEQHFVSPAVRTIKFPREGVNAFHVYLADASEALVEARTGSVIAHWRWTSDPAAFLFDLHANLLIAAQGRTLNGYLALVLLFFALSGLVLWVPRRRSTFRLRYALPRTASPAALLRGHAASGVCLLVPVVVFAGTGAALVFYEPFGHMVSRAFDRQEPAVPSAVVLPRTTPVASLIDVLNAVEVSLPEAGPTMYYPGRGANVVLTFRKRLPGEWHPHGRSYVLVDPYTGRVVQSIDARLQGAGTRFMHAMYPVHAAKTGGPLLVVAGGAAAVGLSWLAVGGIWAYVSRLVRSQRLLLAGFSGVLRTLDLQHGVRRRRRLVPTRKTDADVGVSDSAVIVDRQL